MSKTQRPCFLVRRPGRQPTHTTTSMLRFVLLAAVIALASAQCTTYGDTCKCYSSSSLKVSGGICDGESFKITTCANSQAVVDTAATASQAAAALMTQAIFDAQAASNNAACVALGGTKSTMTASEYCSMMKAQADGSCEDSLCAKLTAAAPSVPVCCDYCESSTGKYCDKTNSDTVKALCTAGGCKTSDCFSAASSIVPSMALLALAAIAAMFF